MLDKKIILWIILICFGGMSVYTGDNRYKQSTDEYNKKIDILEENIIGNYLKEDLWTTENIYDSGHVLQVPLEAAFRMNNIEWKNSFSNQFKRFVENYNAQNSTIEKSRLNYLHYLNLSSRFISLAHEYGELNLVHKDLPNIIYKDIMSIYFEEEAWQWERKPFRNMEERLQWKLENRKVDESYYRAIIDEEMFIFAIAANLRSYYIEDSSNNNLSEIESILDLAFEVFSQESYFTDEGGWLFQPGVWEDHPDYKYAGNLRKLNNITPAPVQGISTDRSHFHRFPLFIKDFIRAYEEETEKKEFFIRMRDGLTIQLVDKVLVRPSEEFKAYRLNNYMDGRNGIYRWNYETQGIGNGYGPYELSGTFLLGWWGFLESDSVRETYEYTLNQFPLDKNVIDIYVGPNTTRERNKYVRFPDFLENGFAELICKLIVDMK